MGRLNSWTGPMGVEGGAVDGGHGGGDGSGGVVGLGGCRGWAGGRKKDWNCWDWLGRRLARVVAGNEGGRRGRCVEGKTASLVARMATESARRATRHRDWSQGVGGDPPAKTRGKGGGGVESPAMDDPGNGKNHPR